MSAKKGLIILILKLLENESDEGHPITQRKLCEAVSALYPCDRKTVGRNIRYLQSVGYPIVKTAKGFYLSGKGFSVEELHYVLAALDAFCEKEGIDKASLTKRLTVALTRVRR